ncbi:DUF6428 family protein [Algoriphagus litoralis]|uniref:DUF6428 family protein n=1 Tax=Algoriphagus litoralis TaxID=2202829 RepID=UPI000DB9DCC1|nr:DUF6428 family protein [Algoriphagus litoralis]
MKLSEIKSKLPLLSELTFLLPDGSAVPAHFHITEIGQVTKRFIDCGGTLRDEKSINFQLWEDGDYDHRLGAKKLLDIIQLSEKVLGLEDLEVEVEYQGDTIGKYGLEFTGEAFALTRTMTDCLAKEKCGIPDQKPRLKMSDLKVVAADGCSPNSGCC